MKRILISSGKGGVGKTTIAVTLARALSRASKVGILDADVNTANVPIILGFEEPEPLKVVDYRIIPHELDGIRVVSYWFDTSNSVPHLLWSTDRVGKILKAFCRDVDWGDTEVLIVDLPPATSDELVGVVSMIGHIDAVILVVQGSTKSSVHDAKLAKMTFEHFNVPVTGFIQNMTSSYFDDGIPVEEVLGVPCLGRIKLKKTVTVRDIEPVVKELEKMEVL